jgi:hypothetical protein
VSATRCGPTPTYPKSVCDNLAFIYEQLRENVKLDKFYVEKICPRPPLEIGKTSLDTGLISICINLYPGSYPANDKIILDAENVRRLNISSILFSILISIALGMRVAKSVSELWWMKADDSQPSPVRKEP